jgi:predicted PurR-regulated permease PerM
VLIVFALYAAKEVLIPFALSVLFAFLLTPACNWLQRRGLSNPVAVLMVSLLVATLSLGGIMMMWASVTDFASQLPRYKGEVVKKVSFVQQYAKDLTKQLDGISQSTKSRRTPKLPNESKAALGDASPKAMPQQRHDPEASEPNPSSAVDEKETHSDSESSSESNETAPGTEDNPLIVREVPQDSGIDWQSWAGSAGAVFGPIGTAGLVIVFALFLLIYRDDLRDRFIAVVSRGNYQVTTEAIAEASERISRYLGAQILLNVSYGMVFGLGLMMIGWFLAPDTGFPNVLFLAIVAGLVRFIPYVGPLVGAGLPLGVAIAIFPGYSVFFGVLALIVTLELLSNNVVEPWLYGSRTGVSAIAIIFAAVFWGWLWGGVGLLLATPMTVCLVVLGRYIPSLKFFVTLLSDERQVNPGLRVYQRLLAGDPHKLNDVLIDEAQSRSLTSFSDEVIVAAAKRIIKDRYDHHIDDKEMSHLLLEGIESSNIYSESQSNEERPSATEASKDQEGPNATSESDPHPTAILECCVLAARHPAEKVILHMLQKIMSASIDLQACETSGVPETDAQSIAEHNPAAVVIVSLPNGGMRQTRFWCQSLRATGYSGTIVVARLGRFRNYDDLFLSFRRAGATTVTTTIAQTVRRLEAMRTSDRQSKTSPRPVALTAGLRS